MGNLHKDKDLRKADLDRLEAAGTSARQKVEHPTRAKHNFLVHDLRVIFGYAGEEQRLGAKKLRQSG
ncbi:hypothetical protein C8A03DRAFT_37483 [Achaetomium macrosporum]|uniref:Uncharacterized protein n=1 Tax=Achaetomium macrosporum TaxID=79813 RepID=A0AAN7H4N8_9PEZI|nr:hypothetical protein C8A03DRAFT_37483 [Achaetomium macrosporum]